MLFRDFNEKPLSSANAAT